MSKTVGTGVRLSPARMAKLADLAKQLAVSRNEAVGLLIEAGRVESNPIVSAVLSTNSKSASVKVCETTTSAFAGITNS